MAQGGHYARCDCCDLEYPARDGLPWRERKAARRLKILESTPQAAEGGPYREYWVEQEHRVCAVCHADLVAGGPFRAFHRSRSKMAVLTVVAVVALMIVTLPITLPHLMSALYMWPSGRR
jgi:hypothetical protein